MTYETFQKLETEVRQELGLIDEPIVTQAELMSEANTAIEKAEKQILTLYEDYYKTSDYLNMVTGTSAYAMPADIHATKLRGVVFSDGNTIYELRRLRGPHLFSKIATINAHGSSADYRYDIENASAAGGMKFVLYPAARETSNTLIRRWYIRKAAKIVLPTDLIDVPEGYQYVKACVKYYAASKEPGLHDMAALKAEIAEQFEQMTSTLADKTPDEDNAVPMDTSWYDDHA